MDEDTRIDRGDVLVGVGATLVVLLELGGGLAGLDQPVVGVLCALLLGGALTTRRVLPITSYVASTVGLAGMASLVFLGGAYTFVNLASIFAAGQHGGRRSWVSLPVAGAGMLVYFSLADERELFGVVVFLLWAAAWFAGTQLGERQAEEARRRADASRVAVAEERTRLARDLHDQVGHAVTVMLVHAGAAQQVLDRDPDSARASLSAIEDVGRRTMTDLDRLLGSLRSAEDRVEEHAAAVRATGLEVDVVRSGRVPEALLPVVGRIVQEALTNVVRHADAGRVDVEVTAVGGAVVVAVEDDGVGGHVVPGRGLRGMRERVADAGGTLDVAAGRSGGTRLVARLPVEADA